MLETLAGEVDISKATVLAGVVFANLAAIVTAFISVKVGVAKLEVRVDTHEKDLNAAFAMIRDLTKKGCEK